MKNGLKYYIILLLFSMFGFSVAITGQSITVNPPVEVVAMIDAEFDVSISVDNVSNIFGTSFKLNFSNEYFKVASVTNETFFGSDVVLLSNTDSSNGIVGVGISRKSGQGNVSGSGDLLKVTFSIIKVPLADTTINFTFTDVTAIDNHGDAVVLTGVNNSMLLIVDDPPVVGNIPDQTIDEGGSFDLIILDDFVNDPDNVDNELTWVTSGNSELILSIDTNRIVTIGLPNVDWFGSETITFKVTDPYGLSDSASVLYTVNPVNDAPIVANIPNQTVNAGVAFASINLDDFVTDIDNIDSEMSWVASGNTNILITIDANRVATISTTSSSWAGSETITFTSTDVGGLSDSDDVTFKVNAKPVVGSIPPQTIDEGNSFASITLDNFVTDSDNADSEIIWSALGNGNLTVNIDSNRIATITITDENWNGVDTLFFTATDPGGLSDSTSVLYTVNPVNDAPVVTEIPSQTINEGATFTAINLDDFVSDVDNTDDEMSWTFTGNTDLIIAIDSTRIAKVTAPNENWNGSETITFTATDKDGLSDSTSVKFTVSPENDAPVVTDIINQTINEGSSFATINLDDFVSDLDNNISEIVWSVSGNTNLQINIDTNRIATITALDENWNGSETLVFTATDPEGLTGNNAAIFKINPINDSPVIKDLPESISFKADSSFTLNMWDYVSDVETENSDLIYQFVLSSDSLYAAYNNTNGECVLTSHTSFSGEVALTITVKDDSNATVEAIINIVVDKATGISDWLNNGIPNEYSIKQNYPNPFNPTTVIRYAIPEAGNVRLAIYNLLGEEVAQLVNEVKSAGFYEVNFNATNFSSGIYIYRIEANNFTETKKMVLLR